MASRWSTEGVMGYLICMDDTRAFHLQHGRKACYFDCHRQFLPTHHSYRRNKKAFKKNRVKNKVARPRLTKARSSIRSNVMPKAVYTLGKDQKRRVCEWIRDLKFDGYASNLACYVDMMELRMHGMKSHDCHVFMQKLISIAFSEMLSEHVWRALTEDVGDIGRGRGRDRGPPSPAKPADPTPTTPSSEAMSQPPQIPADSGTMGSYVVGASSSQALHRPWDAPPPPITRATTSPTGLEALHQPPGCEVSYWWDCDDERMFKVVKSQVGKFLQKPFANAPTSWPDRYGWPRRSGASFWSFGRAQNSSIVEQEYDQSDGQCESSGDRLPWRVVIHWGIKRKLMEVFEKVYKREDDDSGAVRG
ncbi:UNVERIFIED_CONTAM: hypothetical protein Sradi_2461500 [Sesamum radiatum]|uniref:Uncharacterized protein n=1 Tax=Sesamum radiatum TaxID=300843 RepID=A0AAW2SIY9_SESRA